MRDDTISLVYTYIIFSYIHYIFLDKTTFRAFNINQLNPSMMVAIKVKHQSEKE